MNTFEAAVMGEMYRNRPVMVFDWEKAAKIIRDEKPSIVEAGLAGDWGNTGGVIYSDGEIVESGYTYLASTWATPTIMVDGTCRDCYLMKCDTKWGSDTKWPDEAKAILGIN